MTGVGVFVLVFELFMNGDGAATNGFVRFDDDDDAFVVDELVVTGRVDVLAVFRGVRCFLDELIFGHNNKKKMGVFSVISLIRFKSMRFQSFLT